MALLDRRQQNWTAKNLDSGYMCETETLLVPNARLTLISDPIVLAGLTELNSYGRTLQSGTCFLILRKKTIEELLYSAGFPVESVQVVGQEQK